MRRVPERELIRLRVLHLAGACGWGCPWCQDADFIVIEGLDGPPDDRDYVPRLPRASGKEHVRKP